MEELLARAALFRCKDSSIEFAVSVELIRDKRRASFSCNSDMSE